MAAPQGVAVGSAPAVTYYSGFILAGWRRIGDGLGRRVLD
jgi:hypothetical protein